jgi:hypothetical protein
MVHWVTGCGRWYEDDTECRQPEPPMPAGHGCRRKRLLGRQSPGHSSSGATFRGAAGRLPERPAWTTTLTASPEHPNRKLITNQIQISSKLRWPLQSSNWIWAVCATRGRSGWSLRALHWRAIGLRRDQRRTIRPRQRGRLPATPPLRSWRRGSIGEEVDVEAALVGLHFYETSSVSRSRRRAQYKCAGCRTAKRGSS